MNFTPAPSATPGGISTAPVSLFVLARLHFPRLHLIRQTLPLPCRTRNLPNQLQNKFSYRQQPQSITTSSALRCTMASLPNNLQPVCQNCSTSTTPLWRRDENGSVLCNACGLFLKLHGRARPISLKTDVIKSRNRVKAAGKGVGAKKVRMSLI